MSAASLENNMDYVALLDFTSPNQRRIIETIIKEGSHAKAAKKLGLNRSTVSMYVKRVKRAAARRGYSPEHDMQNPTSEMFFVKGTSNLYRRGEDEPLLRWVKTQADHDQLQVVAEEAAEAFFEAYKPIKLIPVPKKADKDLLAAYVLSDLHLGMFSWAQETGEDYDCEIASQTLIGGMNRLMTRTPSCEEALIIQLGDLLHSDDDQNQTRRSGNALDVDTRYQRVAEVGLKLYRQTIDLALRKHKKVRVINVPGNHDEITTYWLGKAIETAYEKNPRVTVDNTPGPFFYHRFGQNFIGMAHGHTCKMAKLGEVMVADRPQDVGECEFRYWLTGHIHHERLLDNGICRVESFRSPAAKDAWHAASGYRAKRDMKAIVYHREFGESERFTVSATEITKHV